MVVKNVMEEYVFQKMDSINKNSSLFDGFCDCPQCRADVAALVLNELPAHYIATEKGELFLRVEQMAYQYDTDVISALSRAVEIVCAHPRHHKA